MTDDVTGAGDDRARDQDAFDDDDELRAALRRVDPASSLSPADPTRVARLLEEAMSPVIEHQASEHQAGEHQAGEHDLETTTRQTGTHHRNPLTWLVAAAAVLLIAGVGAFGLINRGGDPVPTARDGSTASADSDPGGDLIAGAEVTELTAGPAGAPGRCLAPTPEVIRNQAVAFEATVTSITGGVVTLAPSTVFAGKVGPQVQVTAPPADLQALIGAVKFEVGKSYLVSATDGQVTVCGFTGPATPSLQKLYGAAFPG